jgi:hypothetical protein
MSISVNHRTGVISIDSTDYDTTSVQSSTSYTVRTSVSDNAIVCNTNASVDLYFNGIATLKVGNPGGAGAVAIHEGDVAGDAGARILYFTDSGNSIKASINSGTNSGDVTINNNVSNKDITVNPSGTGNVKIGNFTFDADQTVGAGQDNYVFTYDNGTGLISLEAAAGGGITGTVANDQVVVGTGASTVDSSSSFTFDGATFAVTASTAHDFYSGGISSVARFGRNANENFRLDVTDANGTITLDQDETDATSHQFIFNIESANTGARGFEFQDNGTMVMEIDFLNDQIITDGVDFAMTKTGAQGDTIFKIEGDSDNLIESANAILHLAQDGEAVHATFETQDTGNLVALTSGTTFAGRTTVISWPYNSTAVSFAGSATVAGTLNANGGIAFDAVTDTVAGIQNQNLLDKTATETVSGAYTFSNAANVLTGNITSTVNANSGIEAGYLGVNSTSGSDGHGLSLYNGYVDGQPTYGYMFAQTATFGTHGDVSADWATYATMNNTANRGWIWRDTTNGNVASISNVGTLTLGANANVSQPWLALDSDSAGDNWTVQGAGISVGESGKKGSAAIHMTYNGDGSGYIGMGAVDNTASTGGRPAYGHFDFTYNNYDIKVGGRLFPGTNSNTVQSTKYIEATTGYGSINVAGGGTSSYAGYSINNDIAFMSNGTTHGLYNAGSSEWIISSTDNSYVYLYYAGTTGLRTTNGNTDGISTWAQVKHNNGSWYDVGMNVMPRFVTNASVTLAHQHAGGYFYSNNATTYTITLNNTAAQGASFPIDGTFFILNYGSGSVTVNTGSGTLYNPLTGGNTTGSYSVGGNSVATILKYSADNWFIWGDDIS